MAFSFSRRSISVPPASHHELTNDSTATWSCYLKYSGIGGFMNGSGVIVEFDTPPIELQSRLPGLHILSSPLETRYALLTCHHTIPDWHATQGAWWLYVGSGKRAAHKLDDFVCGVVSCCGENGVISSGSNRSNVPVLLPHQKDVCRLKLDFTLLFLNQYFERQVMKRGMPRPPLVHIPSFPNLCDPQAVFSKIESDAASGTEDRMQLYHREEGDVVILPVEIDRRLSTSTVSDSCPQLKDEIATYRKYQRIHYTQSVGSGEGYGEIVEGYSGSALVYYNPETEETQLVGIHVGIATDEEENDTHTPGNGWYIGVSIYGIFQLLSGNPAAFFAIMEHHSARRMWSFRWAHLLTHQLEKCKRSLSLEYLVEILHQIFEKSLIQLDFKALPESILAALRVLTAIFKCFDISGQGDVAAALEMVYAGNKKKIKEFEDNVTELTKSLPDLLLNVGTDDEEMAKACSECYNVMLNFKYEGIVQGVLHTGDSLACLGQLHKTYKCPEILGNFIDILLKCRLIMKNKHAKEHEAQLQQQKDDYEAQLQQQKEDYEAQLQQQKDDYEAQLQQQKEDYEAQLQQQKDDYEAQLQQQKEDYEAQLQQQKEDFEAQLQRQIEEHETQLQRWKEEHKTQLHRQKEEYGAQLQRQKGKNEVRVQQLKEGHKAELQQQERDFEEQKEKFQTSLREQKEEIQRRSAAECELKTKNARLNLDVQNLQVDQQRLQQFVERLKKEKVETATATEKYRRALEQLKEEKQELEGKIQQQEQQRGKIEKELQETRQKTYELTTEREKWRSRVADHERREKKLSEDLEQAKAENEKLHRQLGGMIN